MMNIQFMTKEANGIPTGEFNWKGEENFLYVPNFEELVKNASCEEEIEAIRKAEEMLKDGRVFKGFTFQIVYMSYEKSLKQDFKTGKCEWVMKWQMMQHPWYRTLDGVYKSKEEMIEEIEKMYK